MKIDRALYTNEKQHRYFIVDTILSRDLASAFWPLCVSYALAYRVDVFAKQMSYVKFLPQ